MARVKVNIRWTRKAKFEAVVEEFERRYIREIKRVVRETVEIIVGEAKANVPYDTGALHDSIEVVYFRGGLSAQIKVGEDYGIYVEFGTGIYARDGDGRKTPWVYFNKRDGRYYWTQGNRPQPFFTPAVEAGAAHFRRELNRLG